MEKKELGTQNVNVRLTIYKFCITACFAIIFSIFLFACGSAKDANSSDSTNAAIQADTTSTVTDTTTMPMDTSHMRPDSTPMR